MGLEDLIGRTVVIEWTQESVWKYYKLLGVTPDSLRLRVRYLPEHEVELWVSRQGIVSIKSAFA